jgi:hypothetical protein
MTKNITADSSHDKKKKKNSTADILPKAFVI